VYLSLAPPPFPSAGQACRAVEKIGSLMPPALLDTDSSQGMTERGFNVFMVAAATLTPSSQVSAYMRVAAMTLAAYE
jgi:hypothetical protein